MNPVHLHPENRRQYHTRRLSRRQLRPHENYVHNWMYAGSDSEAVDTSLDVSSIGLTTLRDAAKYSPVPFLSAAAGIAVEIVAAVQVSYSSSFQSNWILRCISQNARRNRGGFKALADDSCELVYVIIRAFKNRPRADDMPVDLVDNLQQLATYVAPFSILTQININLTASSRLSKSSPKKAHQGVSSRPLFTLASMQRRYSNTERSCSSP